MGKKNKTPIESFDFDTGIGGIIPATQEAFKRDEFSQTVRKNEKESLTEFKKVLGDQIDKELSSAEQFPTDNEVFIFVVQFFAGEREYRRRDIDNIAKTILDVLNGRFYYDDSQVRTLLVSKKMESRVPQNFAYVAIKDLKSGNKDVNALKISNFERSISLFKELRKRGVLN